MSKIRLPNQKNLYKKLNSRLARYVGMVQAIYDSLNLEASKIAVDTDYPNNPEGEFHFSDYPETRKRVNDLQSEFVNNISSVIFQGTSREWKESNLMQDLLADKVYKRYLRERDGEKQEVYYQTNNDALKAFQQRKDRGLNLSQKLWKQSGLYKEELETAISTAIERGTDAITLSKKISQYLNDFPSLQKDYTEKFGHASKANDCEYRSIRLARSEINMAYRKAEQLRWQQMDFVVGYEIHLSNSHPKEDICDRLAGKYPKDFVWTGWHPSCYDDITKVLTNEGWKLFSDVRGDEKILSLNPDTRETEWTSIIDRQCWRKDGDMRLFKNKYLDCLVTPEHRMVYLNKFDGRIKYTTADDFRKCKGAFYRGCLNSNPDRKSIVIGCKEINFDWFCEFMGYYLSDGSTLRKSQIIIAQKDGETSKPIIMRRLENAGYHVKSGLYTLDFYDTELCTYLKRFGLCYDKYIPSEILNASQRQIRIFLDAFSICDGHRRKNKDFLGSHGHTFHSDNEEITYFTTSNKMAGNLSELILKVGCRPSFYIQQPKTSVRKNGSIIKANYPCYVIRECKSVTATVFTDEAVEYHGYVYDLTLDRNHIMYVSRNGKCFWGSNCMCYKTSILKDEDEFWADDDDVPSRNEVTDVPDAFKEWVNENEDRIRLAEKHGTLPYFLRDNKEYVDEIRKEHKEAVKERNSKPSLSMSGSTSNDDIKKGSNVESPNLPTATKQEIEEEAKANYSFAQRDFFDDFTRVTGIERGLSMPVELADRLNANPEFDPQIPEYSRNCASTVVAYVMREFGFDVKASGCSNKLVNAVRYNDVPWYSIWMNGANRPMELKDVSTIKNWAKEKGVTDITPDMYLDFFDEKCKDIGTYIACVPWKVKIDPVTGEKFYNGHYAIIKRLEDGMKYIDPQRDNQRGSAYSYMSLYWLCHSMETRLNGIEKFAGVMKVSDKLLDWNFYDIVQGK